MKVVLEEDNTADVSTIQSVSVITAATPIKVCVKYKTEKTGKQKVSYLACPSPKIRRARRNWPESAEVIANELENLSKRPGIPIEQIVELTAWRKGHLKVKMDPDSHASARGLAFLCVDWPFGQKPPDKELKFRTGLSADGIKKVTNTDIYKQSIKVLMLKSYDSPDKLKWWIRDYERDMPKRFGKRMRLSEVAAAELINSMAEEYGIDLGDLKASSAIFKAEKRIGSGGQSVYLYYYQWDRDSVKSEGKSVWECKIGFTERPLQERLRELATDPEKFKLGLHIKTDRPKEIEDTIHDELKKRGKHLDESLKKEWFRTSPSEVEEIYNFIGERSRESASSILR